MSVFELAVGLAGPTVMVYLGGGVRVTGVTEGSPQPWSSSKCLRSPFPRFA